MSAASSSKTAKPAAASASRKVPVDTYHKGPRVSGASKVTTICKTKVASAKGCVKSLKITTKSKSLVSKSKTNATMLADKKIKDKLAVAGAVKKVVLKKKVLIKPKTAAQTGGSKVKPKPVKCDAMDNKSAVEEAGGVPKSMKTIVTESVSDADEVTETLAIGEGKAMEESVPLKCTDSENQPRTGDSNLEPKPVASESVGNKSAVLEERGSVHKSVKTSSAESPPDAGTVPEKLAIAEENIEESVPEEYTDAENQPRTVGSKLQPKPVTSETVDNKSAVEVGGEKLTIAGTIHQEGMPGDAEKQPEAGQNKDRPVSGTCVSVKEMDNDENLPVFSPDSQADAAKCIKTEVGEPMQLVDTQSTQVQEVHSGTFLKREKSPPLDISTDEPSRKPAAPPLQTPPSGSPVEASQQTEPKLPGETESTAETPEIKTEALNVQQSDGQLKTKQDGRLDTWPHASTLFINFHLLKMGLYFYLWSCKPNPFGILRCCAPPEDT